MKTNLRRSIASLLIVSMTGCSGPHKLTRDDQLSLPAQPEIHAVLHSPAAAFTVTTVRPDGMMRLQHEVQLEDPAPRIKAGLVSALQANLNLRNVHTVSDSPQNDDVKTLKRVFKTGVVLDVRTMEWGVENDRASYSARARMVRLEDLTVLWEATCSERWNSRALEQQWVWAKRREVADNCAAQLSAKALGKDRKPVSVTGPTIPAEGLPSVPRIVVDEHPIELAGFEMTSEERAQFKEWRSARIDQQAEVRLADSEIGKGILLCVIPPLCAAVWLGVGVMMGVHSGIKRAIASAREPSLIPEQSSSRLAAMLKEQATGASLAERIWRLPESASVPAAMEAGSPHLVVRMKAARTDYSGTRAGVSIVAHAQAFPNTGAEWEPTEHRYEFSSLAWTAKDAELVRREIDGALDALAESISWAYLSILPTGASAKEARKAPPIVKDDRQELVRQE